jgi:glutamine cyclotransferase
VSKKIYIILIITFFLLLGIKAQFTPDFLWESKISNNEVQQYSEIEMNVVDQFHYEYFSIICGLTYDGEYIWFSDIGRDSLIAIDKNTGEKIKGFPFPMDPDIYGLTFDGENLWASTSGLNLFKINHEDGSIITSFQLPYSPGTSGFISELTWHNNTLYCTITAGNNGVIVGIDVDNIICTDTIAITNPFGVTGLTYMNGYFWVNDNLEFKIRKVNPDNGQYEAWFPHYYLCYSWIGLTTDGEYMYCSDAYRNIFKYEIIDKTVNNHSIKNISEYKNEKIPDSTYQMEFTNKNEDKKYDEIEMNLVDNFHFNYLSIIRGLAFDGEYLWFSDCANDSLIAIDRNTGEKIKGFPFPMDPDIYGLAFDGENFWASAGHYLYKIDHEDGSIITSFHIPYAVSTNSCISELTWHNGILYCTYTAGFSSAILGVDVDNIVCVDTLGPGGCSSPTGLTYMNGFFWINDFIETKIRKVNTEYGQYEGWFPHYYLCYKWVGLTNDGEYMYCSDDFCNIYKYEIIDTTANIIENLNILPDETKLIVYPNPSDNKINIEFYLPEESTINIDIISISGIMVKNIYSNKLYAKGTHNISCNMENISTGEYIIKLSTNNNTYNQKLIIKK